MAAGGGGDQLVFAVLLFAIAISIDGFAAGVAEGLRGIRVPLGSLLVINVVSAVVVLLSVGSGRAVAGFLAPIADRLIGGGILMALGALMLWRGRASTAGAGDVRPASGVVRGNVATRETEPPRCSSVIHQASSWKRGIGSGMDDAEVRKKGTRSGPGSNTARTTKSCDARGVFLWPARIVEALAMVPGLLDEPARADLDSSGTLTPGEAFLLGLALAIDALGVGFGAGMAGLWSTLTPLIAGVTQFVFVSAGISVGRRIKTSAFAPSLEKVPGGILILLGLMRLR
ncbi:MAG: manganese efflux pump [Bacteroidota bacterium]